MSGRELSKAQKALNEALNELLSSDHKDKRVALLMRMRGSINYPFLKLKNCKITYLYGDKSQVYLERSEDEFVHLNLIAVSNKQAIPYESNIYFEAMYTFTGTFKDSVIPFDIVILVERKNQNPYGPETVDEYIERIR